MTYDASDRKHIRAAEKAAKIADDNRLAYTREIMATKQGREWMWNLLGRCHIFSTAFAAGQPDTTSFRLGEQNLGLQLLADATKAAPREYVLMTQEASHKEIINDGHYDRGEHTAEPGDASYPGRNDQGSEPITVGEYDPIGQDAGRDQTVN